MKDNKTFKAVPLHGGSREGAGRPKGRKDGVTRTQIDELFFQYGNEMDSVYDEIFTNGDLESRKQITLFLTKLKADRERNVVAGNEASIELPQVFIACDGDVKKMSKAVKLWYDTFVPTYQHPTVFILPDNGRD